VPSRFGDFGDCRSPLERESDQRVTQIVRTHLVLDTLRIQTGDVPALWSARSAFRRDCGFPRDVVNTSASGRTGRRSRSA
jgi:hypothetical protein